MLVRTDTLHEGLVRLLKRQPHRVPALLAWSLRGPAALRAEVARRVELDVTRLPARAAVEAVLRLSETLMERELALEVSLPASAEGGELEETRLLLEGMGRQGAGARFLRVSEGALGEEAQDVEFLRALVDLAGQHGAGVSVGEAARRSVRVLPTYVAAGVKKVECAAPFERLALASYSEAVREGLEQKAQKAGVGVGQILGILGAQLAPLGAGDEGRLEALTFVEASEIIGALGAAGSGWKSMLFLADRRND